MCNHRKWKFKSTGFIQLCAWRFQQYVLAFGWKLLLCAYVYDAHVYSSDILNTITKVELAIILNKIDKYTRFLSK